MESSKEIILEIRNLDHEFQDAGKKHHAVKDVTACVRHGEFIGLIGRTGSGKSTLIQHMNGLLKATSGDILFHGRSIYEKDFPMKELRQKVGLVFQYPEHQLFEETLLKDVCFGPLNQGLSKEESEERAREAMALTGIPEEMFGESPFSISGGQKRRAAIAGVLAMKPEVLILDEPTAGLDPAGRKRILDQIYQLYQETGLTVILVSHSMEDVARYADRIFIMDSGSLAYDGTPEEIFPQFERLETLGLRAPEVTYILHDLKEKGLDVDTSATTVDEAAETILNALRQRKEAQS